MMESNTTANQGKFSQTHILTVNEGTSVKPETGVQVKRVINELEANFNSIRGKQLPTTTTIPISTLSTSFTKTTAIKTEAVKLSPQASNPRTLSNTATIGTETSPASRSFHSGPEVSFKPVPISVKVPVDMDSDSSYHHEKPVPPLTTVSVSTCPSCGSENVSSNTSNALIGTRRSASFQHINPSSNRVTCNGHKCDPFSDHLVHLSPSKNHQGRHLSASSKHLLSSSMNNVHRSRSFNCNVSTIPILDPDHSSTSCDCQCRCIVCTGKQQGNKRATKYNFHHHHLNHPRYPVNNYRRHKKRKVSSSSFRHGNDNYPMSLDPMSLGKPSPCYCPGCISSSSNTTTSNLIPSSRCNNNFSSYFAIPKKSSSYQLHHDDHRNLINMDMSRPKERLNGIYRDYRYWNVDEWRLQLKRERAKRKERRALMFVSAIGIIIFICISYFGTLLFLRVTKLP